MILDDNLEPVFALKWRKNSCWIDSALWTLYHAATPNHRKCRLIGDCEGAEEATLKVLARSWTEAISESLGVDRDRIFRMWQGQNGGEYGQFGSASCFIDTIVPHLPDYSFDLHFRSDCSHESCSQPVHTKRIRPAVITLSKRITEVSGVPESDISLSLLLSTYFTAAMDPTRPCPVCKLPQRTVYVLKGAMPERLVVHGHWSADYVVKPDIIFDFLRADLDCCQVTYRPIAMIAYKGPDHFIAMLIKYGDNGKISHALEYDGMAVKETIRRITRRDLATWQSEQQVTVIMAHHQTQLVDS